MHKQTRQLMPQGSDLKTWKRGDVHSQGAHTQPLQMRSLDTLAPILNKYSDDAINAVIIISQQRERYTLTLLLLDYFCQRAAGRRHE
jgi:hypothetical protein